MGKGTCLTQLAEVITSIRGEANSLKEEQGRKMALIEEVLQQLNHLASSYGNLVQLTTKLSQERGLQTT